MLLGLIQNAKVSGGSGGSLDDVKVTPFASSVPPLSQTSIVRAVVGERAVVRRDRRAGGDRTGANRGGGGLIDEKGAAGRHREAIERIQQLLRTCTGIPLNEGTQYLTPF